ncbi:hypothetical protein SLEP1_g25891 [Rubroshorea leprosula]|uniref:Uncharacterized protein n=1 Tax=Rubroshorea leprosula TaxID=152421 RepID=A0AAV5JRP3_9ROSI|nr:hypothetical protein SLEP1_g25891 [Rubroshorea leprosula]
MMMISEKDGEAIDGGDRKVCYEVEKDLLEMEIEGGHG